jgi:hypothetical protein
MLMWQITPGMHGRVTPGVILLLCTYTQGPPCQCLTGTAYVDHELPHADPIIYYTM